MEIKYTILTKDAEGNEHNVGFDSNAETITKLLDILLKGVDPNHLVDIVIRQEIRK